MRSRRAQRDRPFGRQHVVLGVLAFAIALFLLSSCAALQSKEVAIGCQVADAGTTMYATHIGAAEQNPIIPNNNVLVLIKAGLIAVIATQWDKMNDFGRGAVTALSCGPVINNVNEIRKQRAYNREAGG